jgi:DNA replication protein DnaC
MMTQPEHIRALLPEAAPGAPTVVGAVFPLVERTAASRPAEGKSADEGGATACPLCHGQQWFRQDLPIHHPDFGKLIACICLQEKRREQRRRDLLQRSGLSEAQQACTLDSFYPYLPGVQMAFEMVTAYVKAFSALSLPQQSQKGNGREPVLTDLNWVVLIGPVGTGKTHLALAMANAAIAAEIVAFFATVPDLLDHLRATFSPDATITYDTLFDQTRTAEFLVLDDLGTQRSSPWAEEKLFQLIDYRYRHRLPTIITINSHAWQQVDLRLLSRLRDHRLAHVISMNEARDYRSYQQNDHMKKGSFTNF